MFTGIIQASVSIKKITPTKKGVRVKLEKPARFKMKLGDSIALDGICTTVMSLGRGFFEVEFMPETLSKTTAREWTTKHNINAEQSLCVGQAIDGHIVQGHVDTVGKIQSIKKEGSVYEIAIAFPSFLRPYLALRGSIAVNGVSLTAAHVTKTKFVIALIPFTLTHTNLGSLKQGDSVNIEVDSIARIVVTALEDNIFSPKKKTYAKR